MEAHKVIILVHPFIYRYAKLKNKDYKEYLAIENVVADRWVNQIRMESKDTVFIQIGRRDRTVVNEARRLGIATIFPRVPLCNAGPREYIVKLTLAIMKEMRKRCITVTSDATWHGWGESYEGCVPLYLNSIMQIMGIPGAPIIDISYCVPDDLGFTKTG